MSGKQAKQKRELERKVEALERKLDEAHAEADPEFQINPESVLRIQQKSVTTEFAGPLPHPDILRQYGTAVPDAPNRIIKMAEQEQLHRQELEQQVLDANIQLKNRELDERRSGQRYAFLIVILFILAGAYLHYLGQTLAGNALLGATMLGGIVRLFLNRSTSQGSQDAGHGEGSTKD